MVHDWIISYDNHFLSTSRHSRLQQTGCPYYSKGKDQPVIDDLGNIIDTAIISLDSNESWNHN